jgi:hypothetical protein
MEKKFWIIGIIVLVILIIGGVYLYNNSQTSKQIGNEKYKYSEITYDDCIKNGGTGDSCKQYIFTRNAQMEQKFAEIVNQVIQEQAQKGVTISASDIMVLNLAGKVQGFITLNCTAGSYELDNNITESIADKLFLAYPNDFTEGSKRDSWVDVAGCSQMGSSPDGVNTYYHTTTLRISDGNFGPLI